MFKKGIRAPILALFLLSLGGWVLHYKYHSPWEDASNLIPFVFGGLGTVVLPFMFNYRRTVAWAYLINIAAVVAGTVGMAMDSAEGWTGAVNLYTIVLGQHSLFPDIVMLLAKLPIGHAILMHFRSGRAGGSEAGN
jgi:hypothetical protein